MCHHTWRPLTLLNLSYCPLTGLKDDAMFYPQSHKVMSLPLPLLWGPPSDAQGSGCYALLGAPGAEVTEEGKKGACEAGPNEGWAGEESKGPPPP